MARFRMTEIMQCDRCALCRTRRNIVLPRYVGKPPFDVQFIGEAPGQSEDILGRAFVGGSGKLLDELIKFMKIDSYIIFNVCQCRPCNSKTGENREPTVTEVLACIPNVMHFSSVARARATVFVGATAETYYKKEFPDAVKIIHPAAILREGGRGYEYNMAVLRDVSDKLHYHRVIDYL